MQLRFDPMDEGDEAAFGRTRDLLVAELRGWAAARFADTDGARAANAETFLQWKFNYGDGRLDTITTADASEYLLEWCPRKVAAPPETAFDLVDGLSAYVEMLATSGRLVGGVGRGAELISYLDDLRPEAFAAMGDSSKFGMAKSLFAVPLGRPDGSALPGLLSSDALDGLSFDQLQALVGERMEAFNELPFELRKQYTDQAMAAPLPPRIDLDYVHLPPSAEEATASAAASRLLAMIDGLVDWLGPTGKPITQTGAIKLADARVLVELLATGDSLIGRDGAERSVRSSRELPMLTRVVTIAEAAGATEASPTKLYPTETWGQLPTLERAAQMIDALLDLGPLSTREVPLELFARLAELLDEGVVHWLVGVLPTDTERSIDEIVEFAIEVADSQFPGYRARWTDQSWERLIKRELDELFGVLELAGLVELHDRREQPNRFGGIDMDGGTFTATALLRAVLPDHARQAGYDFDEIADLATAEAHFVVDAYGAGDLDAAQVAGQWRPEDTIEDRITALLAVAARADRPSGRVVPFALLEELTTDLVDPSAAGPAVRQLLDTVAAAHAALYLVGHGLATPEEMDGFIDVGPLVDHLSMTADVPEIMAELFADAQGMADDLLEAIWRHDQPETLPVLEALGRALPDKHLAKTARKAAIKHRSWLANRRHD